MGLITSLKLHGCERISFILCDEKVHVWMVGQNRGDRCLCGTAILHSNRQGKKKKVLRLYASYDGRPNLKETT